MKRDTFRRQKQLANVTMPVHGQSDRNSDGITHQFSTAPPSSLAPHGAGAPMDKNSTINSNDSPLIEGQRNYAAAQLELKSNSSRQCGHEDLNALMGYIQQVSRISPCHGGHASPSLGLGALGCSHRFLFSLQIARTQPNKKGRTFGIAGRQDRDVKIRS